MALYNTHNPTSPLSFSKIARSTKQIRQEVIADTAVHLTNDQIKCISYDGKRIQNRDQNVAIINIQGEDYLLGFDDAKSGKSIAEFAKNCIIKGRLNEKINWSIFS